MTSTREPWFPPSSVSRSSVPEQYRHLFRTKTSFWKGVFLCINADGTRMVWTLEPETINAEKIVRCNLASGVGGEGLLLKSLFNKSMPSRRERPLIRPGCRRFSESVYYACDIKNGKAWAKRGQEKESRARVLADTTSVVACEIFSARICVFFCFP